MKAKITKQYSFSAAHHLPRVPIGHPCHRNHGHNYVVEVESEGDIVESRGWVVDYNEMDGAVKPIVDRVDHRDLNDFMDNPTAEMLAAWILEQLPDWVTAVRISETPKTWAEIRR